MADKESPTKVAHDLGIRPQIIYGLIKRGAVHAFGNKPQLVDPREVKSALANTRTRVPKVKRQAQQADIPEGTIVSWAKAYKGKGAKERRVAMAVGLLRSDEPDGTHFLEFNDGRKIIDAFSTDTFGEMLKKGFAHIESIPNLLGMIVTQLAHEGEPEKAQALDEFVRTLGIEPTEFKLTQPEVETAQPVTE
jgi:hypothetical protein